MPLSGQITLYTGNILEAGTVTVTGTADTGYPEDRLHDRAISLYWKVTAGATNYEFHVYHPADIFGGVEDVFGYGEEDEFGYAGAVGNDCDLLYIVGHNFNGKVCYWEYSDNDTDWVEATPHWTHDDDYPIIKVLSGPIGHDYWRFRVLSIANPMAAEMFMGKGRTFTVLARPKPTEKEVSNVARSQAVGGAIRRIKLSDTRTEWANYIRLPDAAAFAAWRKAMTEIGGTEKPFIVKDINGTFKYMELSADPAIEYDEHNMKFVDISVLEVL